MQQMAQGLASLGRGQDSMLVHMTPGEVHGLQSLAMAHGGSLTINPQTGLPEAGFLSSILPMIAGIGLNAMFPGSGMLIGAGIGGLTALASGDLKKGLFAGLGAYGGAGIGDSLMAAAPTTVPATASAMGVPAAAIGEGSQAAMLAQQQAGFGPAGLQKLAEASIVPGASPVVPSAMDSLMSGAKETFSSPTSAFNFAKANAYPLAAAAAGPAMGMLGTQNTLPVGTGSTGPQNFANYAMKPMQYDPKTGKYLNATYSPVNYSPSYSPNMAYAAGGGSMQDIQANALGGTVPNENQFYPGANIARGGASYAPQAPSATDVIGGYDQNINQYTGEPVRMAGGGLASLDTYAAGGRLLQGPGDGMSDSIPAVIGGAKPQRAALAQGEFVVPADVVSHLGNGSTDAGSKRLYAMMDKVRHARTGSKKQGRQINPDKFMPA